MAMEGYKMEYKLVKSDRRTVYFPPGLWEFLLKKSMGTTDNISDMVTLACLELYGEEFREFLRTGAVRT